MTKGREFIQPEYVEGFTPDKPGIYANSEVGLVVIRDLACVKPLVCSFDEKDGKDFAFLKDMKGHWSFRLHVPTQEEIEELGDLGVFFGRDRKRT